VTTFLLKRVLCFISAPVQVGSVQCLDRASSLNSRYNKLRHVPRWTIGNLRVVIE
jgi:hypothetical protein